MRHRLNLVGQARNWVDSETDQGIKTALGDWLIGALCDPDVDVEGLPMTVDAIDWTLSEVPVGGDYLVAWRLAVPFDRIDVLSIEPRIR